LIYLDNAATTFKKPEAVYRAAAQTMRSCTTPGRGGYKAAIRAAEAVYSCRETIAKLFNVGAPERVIFTPGATYALNTALRSLVRPGERVVISGYEHNAVVRTLHALGAETAVASAPLFEPDLMLEAFGKQLEKGVAAAVCTHVSNVFGYVLPIDDIARLCRERDIPLVIDAAQSAGSFDMDFSSLGAASAAMPGHKGLYGPQGVGVLLCSDRYRFAPLVFGGTGGNSMPREMPDFLPDALEAGTQNVPAIAGLREGARFVSSLGSKRILAHERKLAALADKLLREIPGVETFYPKDPETGSGIVSFRASSCGCEELASAMAERGVAVRAGLHCAPLAHETAGTLDTGTVRASVSAFSSEKDIFSMAFAARAALKECSK